MRRVIHITDQEITVYLVDGKTLVGHVHHANDAKGIETFESQLKLAPGLDTRILVDIAEEEFHLVKVPHVFVLDQKKILERKRRQYFGACRWVWEEKQGREKQGRRDDQFMMCGIGNPELVQRWLMVLRRQCVPVESITTVPLLSRRLFRAMGIKKRHVLFVSHGRKGGVRQTYLVDGRLRHSRLAPTAQVEERAYSGLFVDEIRRMKQFLTSSGMLPFSEKLDVYVMASNEVISLIGRELLDDESTRIHQYDLTAMARRFGFRNMSHYTHADAFHALLAATSRKLPQYTTPQDMVCAYHYRARRFLLAASLAVVFAGGGYTAYAMGDIMQQQKALERLHRQIGMEQRKLSSLERKLSSFAATGFEMRDAVQFQQRIRNLDAQPFDWFPLLGQRLLKYDHLYLDSLGYFVTTLPQQEDQLVEWANKLKVEDDSLQRAAVSLPPVQDQYVEWETTGAEPETPKVRTAPVIVVDGVMEKPGSYRRMMQEFRAMIADLESEPEFSKVVVAKWPLEVRADYMLDMATERHAETKPHAFKLIIVGRALM